MSNGEQTVAIEKLTDVLNELKISYAIGGSIASSMYGVVRFTQDADITVEPFLPLAKKFYEKIKTDFYISEQAMYEAIRSRGNFNIIHLQAVFKIDIFVRAETNFQKQILSRSRKLQLENHAKPLSFVSPEDIILLKLDWYKKSDCSSERQWSDILGVLTAQASAMDFEYLNNWSKQLGLSDLLKKAIADSHT